MEIYTTQPSVLSVLCMSLPGAKLAHPSQVGFLGVQGEALGGLLKQPRSTTSNVRIQPTLGAYGASGSAAQGSLMTNDAVPTAPSARGVPPRGRPV